MTISFACLDAEIKPQEFLNCLTIGKKWELINQNKSKHSKPELDTNRTNESISQYPLSLSLLNWYSFHWFLWGHCNRVRLKIKEQEKWQNEYGYQKLTVLIVAGSSRSIGRWAMMGWGSSDSTVSGRERGGRWERKKEKFKLTMLLELFVQTKQRSFCSSNFLEQWMKC